MKGRVARLAGATVAVVLILAGCIDNDKSLVIVFAVPPEESGDVCSWEVDPEYYLPYGILDVSFGWEYWLHPQVENNMYCDCDKENMTVGAMDVQLEWALVTYEWLGGRETIQSADVLMLETVEHQFPVTGVIPGSEDCNKPGKWITAVPIIPSQMTTRIAAEPSLDELILGARVVIQGTTLGQTEIESNEFVFPVKFCNNCLRLTCCSDDADPNNDYLLATCTPGQDFSPNPKSCNCGG